MRNNHSFKAEIVLRCPFKACGRVSTKHIIIDYVTDQRGNIIEQKVR